MVSILRALCLDLDSEYFLLCFFSSGGKFYSFTFYKHFNPWCPFWVHFCTRCETQVKVHFLPMGLQFWHHFLKKAIFAPLSYFCTFVRNQGMYVCRSVSGCSSALLISAHTASITQLYKSRKCFLGRCLLQPTVWGSHGIPQWHFGPHISDLSGIYVCLHVLALIKHSVNICWMSEGFVIFIFL